MTTRREFVRDASLVSGSVLLSSQVGWLSWAQAAESREMLKRKIPSTGESIPAIGMGTSGSFEVPTGSRVYEALREVL
jgi:hypothetical protein